MFYLQLAIAGLVTGSAYALSSVGLVAIYKGTRVINFAQGAIGMVGAYIYANWVAAGKNAVEGAILGVAAATLVGLVAYFAVIVPLRKSSGLARMVASFGVVLVLEGLAILRWGAAEQSVSPLLNGKQLNFAGLHVTQQTLLILAVALVCAAIASIFLRNSKLGRAIDAAAQNRDSTARLGYNGTLLGALSWIAGSFAAGLGGVLIVPDLGLDESGLTLLVIAAMAAALVGSFNRIWLAVGVSIVLGVAQALIDGTTQIVGLDQFVPLAVIVLMLLLGVGAIPSYASEKEALVAVPRGRPRLSSLAVCGLLLVAAIAFFDGYWQSLLVQGSGMALVAISCVLVIGYLGPVSLMQWTFAGAGGFIAASLSLSHHWPLVLCIVVAALIIGAGSLIVSVPGMRLNGVTLAIVTLSAGISVQTLLLNQFNQGSGYTLPPHLVLFGAAVSPRWLSAGSLAIVLIFAACAYGLRTSLLGRRILSIQASERAARASGLPTYWLKTAVFACAAMVAAVGGVIWAYGSGNIQSGSFDAISSLTLLCFVYINGVGSVLGAVITGIVVALGPSVFSNVLHLNGAAWFDLIGGVGLILALIAHPEGMVLFWSETLAKLRRRLGQTSGESGGRDQGVRSNRASRVEVAAGDSGNSTRTQR